MVSQSGLSLLGATAPGELTGKLAQAAPVAAAVVLIFAALAYRLKGVDRWGAVAGAVLSFLVYVSAGAGAFAVVAVVFCLAALSTRLGYARKRRLGLAERKQGRRWSQVAANLAVATVFAVVSLGFASHMLLLAMMAALSEAAADTVAGEIGQAFGGRVYLISNFERVSVGTDGGISLIGTLAGAVAALVVALTGHWVKLVPSNWVVVVAAAGLLGSMVDALAGATLQRRGWLNNDGVNFVSTAVAAGIAMLLVA